MLPRNADLDEVLAEVAAQATMAAVDDGLAAYRAGVATVGEVLDLLAWAGWEATRVRLRGWAFLDGRAA